jgi:hypothetical protein
MGGDFFRRLNSVREATSTNLWGPGMFRSVQRRHETFYRLRLNLFGDNNQSEREWSERAD